MKTADFDYELPDELIAQTPPKARTDSRLLYVPNLGECVDQSFTDVLEHFNDGDCLVLNDTKVIPARLNGQKASGGKLEVLIERVTGQHTALCHIRCSRSPKPDTHMFLEQHIHATVTGREGALFCVTFDESRTVFEWLDEYGHMPLPPYIERADGVEDRTRYQTVFSENLGAVAAPTAGLHFDEATLQALKAKGVRVAKVTLHVGAGTFKPVKADDISEHIMHSEWVNVPAETAQVINETKSEGGRVIGVGTTVIRSLESAPKSLNNKIEPWQGETDIFITPGFEFRFVDVLITNFHLPKSTLMMLVSAFGGHPKMMGVYQHAVAQRYRFFSYGDAMLIERADG